MAQSFTPLNSGFADQWAQLEADKQKQARNQQLAQALMSTGYTPGPSWAGGLAQVLGAFMGARMQRQGDEKVSDMLKREFELQGKQAEAKRAQELADEERKMRNEIEAQRQKDANKYKYEADNRAMPDWKDPEYATAQARIAAAKAAAEARYRQGPADPFAILKAAHAAGAIDDNQLRQGMAQLALGQSGKDVPSGYQRTQDGGLTYIPGGPADPNRQQPVQPLTGEAKNKLALIDNAIANAKKYAERTIKRDANGKVTDFADYKSNTDDTPSLLRSAIQDMLYAKSGASAPVEEVRKAEGMYGPAGSLKVPILGIPTGIPQEKDSTAGQKVLNLITDLERMRSEIGGAAPQQTQPQQPEQVHTATDPKTGKKVKYVNGSWVPM